VDKLRAEGFSASTVHNRIDPLRVVYRRALRYEKLSVSPMGALDLPAVRGRRDRIEAPERAVALIEALPDSERALWALAFYAGLRRGELRALRVSDVDLEQGVIRVRRGWDDNDGEQDPKSFASERDIPLAGALRTILVGHLSRERRMGNDLVLGRTATLPFVPTTVRRRAIKAWKDAGLQPLSPHEARHCAVSYFIAAGLNPKEISEYAGHSDVRTTWNRYGHLMPGGHEQAAGKLDRFLQQTRVTGPNPGPNGGSDGAKVIDFQARRKYRHGDSNPGFRRERAAS
jgi:integrase